MSDTNLLDALFKLDESVKVLKIFYTILKIIKKVGWELFNQYLRTYKRKETNKEIIISDFDLCKKCQRFNSYFEEQR